MEKELLETPDDDIKHLPIRDMLRLVAYRESLEVRHPLFYLLIVSFELCGVSSWILSFFLDVQHTEKRSKGSSCCAADPRKVLDYIFRFSF